jgi:p-cumate 2,3-dioxygenase alpha subunit
VPEANDEAQMRAFWRRWQQQMGDAAVTEETKR